MAYVYRHIRLDKNEPFYIGIGKDDSGEYKRANHIGNKNSAADIRKCCSGKKKTCKGYIWKWYIN